MCPVLYTHYGYTHHGDTHDADTHYGDTHYGDTHYGASSAKSQLSSVRRRRSPQDASTLVGRKSPSSVAGAPSERPRP